MVLEAIKDVVKKLLEVDLAGSWEAEKVLAGFFLLRFTPFVLKMLGHQRLRSAFFFLRFHFSPFFFAETRLYPVGAHQKEL